MKTDNCDGQLHSLLCSLDNDSKYRIFVYEMNSGKENDKKGTAKQGLNHKGSKGKQRIFLYSLNNFKHCKLKIGRKS